MKISQICALIVQNQVISNQVIHWQLTYVYNSTAAFAYATQHSFDSDHQQMIFTYLRKTTGLFCGIILPEAQNGDKEEKANLQYVITSYIFIYRKVVLQGKYVGHVPEGDVNQLARGHLNMFFVHIFVVILLLNVKYRTVCTCNCFYF